MKPPAVVENLDLLNERAVRTSARIAWMTYGGSFCQLIDAFQPRNSVELAVIEGMAGDMRKSNGADLAAGRRISERLRHEPLEQAKKEQDEAVELGGRLFWQPSFPLPISKRFPIGKLTEPRFGDFLKTRRERGRHIRPCRCRPDRTAPEGV